MGAGHRIIDISADLLDVIRQIVCRSVKPFPPRIGGHAIQQMPMLQQRLSQLNDEKYRDSPPVAVGIIIIAALFPVEVVAPPEKPFRTGHVFFILRDIRHGHHGIDGIGTPSVYSSAGWAHNAAVKLLFLKFRHLKG